MNSDNVEQIRKARAATSEESGPEIAGDTGIKVDTEKLTNRPENPIERLIFRVRTELMNYIDSKAGGAAVNDVLLDSKSIVDAKGIARLNKSAIKKSYEANADTNAFTDAYLNELTTASSDIAALQSSIGELGDEVNSVAGRVTTVENSRIKVFNFAQNIAAAVDVSSYADGQYNATLAFNAMLLDSNRDTVWAKDITLFGTIQVTSGALAGCSLCWINPETGQLRNVTATVDVVQFDVDQSQGVDVQIAYVGIGTSSYVLTVLEAGGSGGGGALIEADGWNDADIILFTANKAYTLSDTGVQVHVDLSQGTFIPSEDSLSITIKMGTRIVFTRTMVSATDQNRFAATMPGLNNESYHYDLSQSGSTSAWLVATRINPDITELDMFFYGQGPKNTVPISSLKFYKFA